MKKTLSTFFLNFYLCISMLFAMEEKNVGIQTELYNDVIILLAYAVIQTTAIKDINQDIKDLLKDLQSLSKVNKQARIVKTYLFNQDPKNISAVNFNNYLIEKLSFSMSTKENGIPLENSKKRAAAYLGTPLALQLYLKEPLEKKDIASLSRILNRKTIKMTRELYEYMGCSTILVETGKTEEYSTEEPFSDTLTKFPRLTQEYLSKLR